MTEKSPYLVDDMGFWDIGKRCKKCGSPLHLESGKEFPICWECIVSKANAERGRALLEKLKAKAEPKPKPKKPHGDDPISPLTWGMPL